MPGWLCRHKALWEFGAEQGAIAEGHGHQGSLGEKDSRGYLPKGTVHSVSATMPRGPININTVSNHCIIFQVQAQTLFSSVSPVLCVILQACMSVHLLLQQTGDGECGSALSHQLLQASDMQLGVSFCLIHCPLRFFLKPLCPFCSRLTFVCKSYCLPKTKKQELKGCSQNHQHMDK